VPHRHHKPGARIFVPVHLISVVVALCAAPARLIETRLQQKLLRKKKNESWAMRCPENFEA
jgi:hypothetical protein